MLRFLLPRWLILTFIYMNTLRMARVEALMDVPSMVPQAQEDIEIRTGVWDGTYDYRDDYGMKEPTCHWHDHFNYEDIEALADTPLI